MDFPRQQDAAAAAGTPPFVVSRPVRQTMPLVFASPHSGRDYPADLLCLSRLDPLTLRRSEDGFVDALFAAAPAHGAPLLVATFPRVYCDANREAWELDPSMFDGPLPDWVNTASPRVGAGLGTIARIVATGEHVYDGRLSFAEAAGRIERLWRPYHGALAGLIEETRRTFGCCLLVDCHSMPSGLPVPLRADFILGDAHGTACAPRAVRQVEEGLSTLGHAVRRNDHARACTPSRSRWRAACTWTNGRSGRPPGWRGYAGRSTRCWRGCPGRTGTSCGPEREAASERGQKRRRCPKTPPSLGRKRPRKTDNPARPCCCVAQGRSGRSVPQGFLRGAA